MSGNGLNFDYSVDEQDRECQWLNDDEHADRDAFLERIAQLRPFTRVIANPASIASAKLKEIMVAGREVGSVEVGGYGIGPHYSTEWSNTGESEDQSLVLVAFDGSNPVGYASLHFSLFWSPTDKEADLMVRVEAVHVQGEMRGRGYGLDLSIASGFVVEDIRAAVYKAVPSGTTIGCSIVADYESEGGEAFTMHLKSALEVQVDLLRQLKERPSIKIEYPELDAGY